jgi:hypothetical protein
MTNLHSQPPKGLMWPVDGLETEELGGLATFLLRVAMASTLMPP